MVRQRKMSEPDRLATFQQSRTAHKGAATRFINKAKATTALERDVVTKEQMDKLQSLKVSIQSQQKKIEQINADIELLSDDQFEADV